MAETEMDKSTCSLQAMNCDEGLGIYEGFPFFIFYDFADKGEHEKSFRFRQRLKASPFFCSYTDIHILLTEVTYHFILF